MRRQQDRTSRALPTSAKSCGPYLTGRGAAINYEFVDMTVEVPRATGPDAERANWKLNGTLRITTAEHASAA